MLGLFVCFLFALLTAAAVSEWVTRTSCRSRSCSCLVTASTCHLPASTGCWQSCLILTDRLNFFLTWSFTVLNGFQRCIVLASFQRAVTQLWVVSIDYTGISPLLKPTPPRQLTPSGLVEQIIFVSSVNSHFCTSWIEWRGILLLKPTAAVDLQLTQLDNNWLKEVSASDVLTSLEFCGVFLYPVLCTRFLWKHWQSKPGQVILCSMGPTTNNNARPHFPRSIHWKTFNLSLCDVKTQDYASFLFVIAVEFIFHCLVWIFSASEGNLYSFPLWMKDDPLKILKHTLRSETKSIIRFKSKLFIGAWNPLQCHHLIWVKDVINCFVKGISTQMYLCIT